MKWGFFNAAGERAARSTGLGQLRERIEDAIQTQRVTEREALVSLGSETRFASHRAIARLITPRVTIRRPRSLKTGLHCTNSRRCSRSAKVRRFAERWVQRDEPRLTCLRDSGIVLEVMQVM